jgi:hypothetical protein
VVLALHVEELLRCRCLGEGCEAAEIAEEPVFSSSVVIAQSYERESPRFARERASSATA